MENLGVCVNAVLPVFILIALGYFVRSRGDVKESTIEEFNKISFKYFMPVLVFSNVYKADMSKAINPKLMVFAAVCVALVWIVCTLIVICFEKEPARRGVSIQAICRSNFLVIGLPFSRQILPPGTDTAPITMLLAVVVPMFNIFSVLVLEVLGGHKQSMKKLVLDVIKNPLVAGTVVGMVFAALKIRFPLGVDKAIEQIGSASSALMIFLLGCFFDFGGFREQLGKVFPITLGRLVIVPAFALTAGYLIGFRGVEFAALLSVFASSTAVASFTMAKQMGGDSVLAQNAVVATSALCSFTLCLWAVLFKGLGAF